MLITLRTELNSATIINVCAHHLCTFLTRYSHLQKGCANYFTIHKKSIILPQGKYVGQFRLIESWFIGANIPCTENSYKNVPLIIWDTLNGFALVKHNQLSIV